VLLLDVWGEGRCIDNSTGTATVSGFHEAQNLNKLTQTVSNGANRGQDIPSLVPVTSYDTPTFPINDNLVSYVTVMGSLITVATAKEIYRALNKKNGVVMLYDLDPPWIANFEANKGLLIHKELDPLNWPFYQPTFRPVRIYGFPGVKDKEEL
jgi:hypothetical protein